MAPYNFSDQLKRSSKKFNTMLQKPALSSSDAMTILEAARREAQANNWNVSIAVCDEGGHLLAFTRMDNANIASAAISQSKAHTAVLIKKRPDWLKK